MSQDEPNSADKKWRMIYDTIITKTMTQTNMEGSQLKGGNLTLRSILFYLATKIYHLSSKPPIKKKSDVLWAHDFVGYRVQWMPILSLQTTHWCVIDSSSSTVIFLIFQKSIVNCQAHE